MPRGRKNRPEIDICRVRTDRFRDMTPEQLSRAAKRVGPLYEIPKKQQGNNKPRWVLAMYLVALREAKKPREFSERSRRAYIERYKEEPKSDTVIRRMNREEADQLERKIWELQTRRGCPITPTELVARDAAREGRPAAEIDQIRGRRRPKIS